MRTALTLAVLSTACLSGSTAAGQEFRMFTTVTDLSQVGAGGARAGAVLSRSVTIFHGGVAWDHETGGGEVVRFDPAAGEFTLLDTRRDLAATVAFAELVRYLDAGRRETEKEIGDLIRKPDPAAAAAADELRFQLEPRFEVLDEGPGWANFAFNPERTLTLRPPAGTAGPTYAVEYAVPPSPEVAAFYLDFAEWTAKLVYVHLPHHSLPAVRSRVHAALRDRGAIPVTVTKRAAGDDGKPIVLRAEHTLHRSLDAHDRDLLTDWRDRLASPRTRHVSFAKYQRITHGVDGP